MKKIAILLYILFTYVYICTAQTTVVHRTREGVSNEREIQVAKGEWKEWTDISYMTPSFLSCKVLSNDNTISFKVETDDYIYVFTEDNQDNSKLLEWNIKNQTQNENGQTFINDYLRTIVPSLGLEYVTTIKRHRDEARLTPSVPELNEIEETETKDNEENVESEIIDPLENLEIAASPVKGTQAIENKNVVSTHKKETNDKEKKGDTRGVLETIIGAFIIFWIFKVILKAFFSPGKKNKNNSWLDQAWFHDHGQKI